MRHQVQLGTFPQGLNYLLQLPTDSLYRLIVDGHLLRTEKGPQAYEQREPGAIGATLDALLMTIEFALNRPQAMTLFDQNIIKDIHKQCSAHLDLGELVGGRYGYSGGYAINKETITADGLKALVHAMLSQYYAKLTDYTDLEVRYTENGSLVRDSVRLMQARGLSEQAIANHIQSLLQNHPESTINKSNLQGFEELTAKYMKQLTLSFLKRLTKFSYNQQHQSVDEFLSTMVHYIQAFHQLHPFADTNLRTFVVVLMNNLLMQHGLPPAIFDNPNIFDIQSKTELKYALEVGMDRTLDLIQGQTRIFGYNHKVDPQSDKQMQQIMQRCYQFQSHTADLVLEHLKTRDQTYLAFNVNNQTNSPRSEQSGLKQFNQLFHQIITKYNRGSIQYSNNMTQPLAELQKQAFRLDYASQAGITPELDNEQIKQAVNDLKSAVMSHSVQSQGLRLTCGLFGNSNRAITQKADQLQAVLTSKQSTLNQTPSKQLKS